MKIVSKRGRDEMVTETIDEIEQENTTLPPIDAYDPIEIDLELDIDELI